MPRSFHNPTLSISARSVFEEAKKQEMRLTARRSKGLRRSGRRIEYPKMRPLTFVFSNFPSKSSVFSIVNSENGAPSTPVDRNRGARGGLPLRHWMSVTYKKS